MIWKFFFVVATLLLMLSGITEYNSDPIEFSNLEYLSGILIVVVIAFALGVFYSLGWKQQLFSKKSINIFTSLSVFSIIICSGVSAIPDYSSLYIENPLAAKIETIIGIVAMSIVLNLFLTPLYIGVYKYKKSFDNLIPVQRPYWKLFSLLCVIELAGVVIYAPMMYVHFSSYNLFDYFVIFSCIYEIIFLIGYSWNINIFSKLFWKISAIPYALLLVVSPFMMSDTFNRDFQFKGSSFPANPVEVALIAVLSIAFLFVLYNYAYKEEK